MKKGLLTLLAAGFIGTTHAQSGFGEMIKGGINDGTELLKAYMTPHLKAFSAGLGSGWYNTGKTHTPGFPDLIVSLNVVSVPTSDRTFDITSLGLKSISADRNTTPTVAGPDEAGANMTVTANSSFGTKQVAKFAMPNGTGLSIIPVPTAQVGIGLPLGTDLMIRYMPTLTIAKGSIGLYGFGIKHDIKQWIPVVNELPFDLSFLFGYTNFKVSYALQVEPDKSNPPTGTDYSGQELAMKVNSYSTALILSKKIAILTVYGGLGYDASNCKLNLNGTYPVSGVDPATGGIKTYDISNPVSELSINTSNGFKFTPGFRVKLGFITIHGDYTFSKYPIASAGLGIAID